MRDLAVQWRPTSPTELARRRRVLSTDGVDLGLDTVLLGLGAVLSPALVFWGATAPLVERIAFAGAACLVFLVCCSLSLRGLYLSNEGVTVWNLIPGRTIPWSDVDRFELRARPVDLGRNQMEWLTVLRMDGSTFRVSSLSRYVGFESRMTPADGVKDVLRTYPTLVEDLNRLRNEMVHQHGA